MSKHDFGIFKIFQRGRHTIIDPSSWVNVVAITPDNEIVMVKQYRAGSGEISLELPGGKVDNAEGSMDAALRELKEETAYGGGLVGHLGDVRPNPAIMNNHMSYFFVQGAVKVAEEQNLDEGEEIEVVLLPYSEIKGLIKSREIMHALTITGIYLYELSREG